MLCFPENAILKSSDTRIGFATETGSRVCVYVLLDNDEEQKAMPIERLLLVCL